MHKPGAGNTIHGMTSTPEHTAWRNMRARCRDSKRDDYRLYGGRGIKVCDRWGRSFQAFYNDIGPKPTPRHSLDRYPDRNGNYEPGNVRWATASEQANNKRTNLVITLDGKSNTIAQWGKLLGIRPWIIGDRLRRGDSAERALRPVEHRHKDTSTVQCACGCGEEMTRRNNYSHLRRYLPYHRARLQGRHQC